MNLLPGRNDQAGGIGVKVRDLKSYDFFENVP
jgi:hypothetical protein